VKGVRKDKTLEDMGIGRIFEFNEDGTYNCETFHRSDNNGDGKMDENESIEVKTKGKWIPLGKQDATQLGLSCDAVAVEYQTTDMVKLPSMEKISEGEATVQRDTMFIVQNQEEGMNFLFKSDLVQLQMSGQLTRTRADLWSWLIKTGQEIANGLEDAWKWTKALIADKYDPQVTGNSDWMGKLFKDVNPKMHEISIPGTHDSFTYNLSKATGLWGKTQVFNLEQQFDAGIRYFDFRLGVMNISNLGFYHGFLCTEVSLPKALDKLRKLLKEHPGETVIAMLKFEYGGIDEDRINTLKKILDDYKDILVDPSKFGPDIRYNDCKGKILLMQRFSFSDGKFGIFCNGQDRNEIEQIKWGDKQWKVMEQDECECSVTTDNGSEEWLKHIIDRKDLLINNFKDASNTPSDRPDTWHLNKTSGYIKINGIIMSYSYNANCMNQLAIEYISEHLGEKTGWVVMDYAGLHTEGAVVTIDVYGDDLVRILLKNNSEMVKRGVLK
jgi:hypothetical protein